MTNELAVGDIVRIKGSAGTCTNPFLWFNEMDKFIGATSKIVAHHAYEECFDLEIDDRMHIWAAEWLEKVE